MARSFCVLFPLILLSAQSAFPQTASPSKPATSQSTPAMAPATDPATAPDPGSEPPPLKPEIKITAAEKEVFLKTATIVNQKVMEEGTTKSVRATLSTGTITHDAHIQFVDVYKPVFRGVEGTVEKNFRDSYKFNIAAFKLARLLGLESMVPMSVEREIDGRLGSVTWWLDNIWMTEEQRRDKKIKPPATQEWVDQLNVVRVFDQLIYNTDRNQGNLLITPDWRIWMIDHTRAFRVAPTLMRREALGRCDFTLLQNLKTLTRTKLSTELGPYLRPEEIAGILARRDLIVAYFKTEVSKRGEDAVLTGIPRKTPNVSVP